MISVNDLAMCRIIIIKGNLEMLKKSVKKKDKCIKKLKKKHLNLIILLTLIVTFMFSAPLLADNISTKNKYAYAENASWINFSTTHEQATVYDDHLEGYVWSETVGWIRLGTATTGTTHTYTNNSPITYGVNNDGNGNLSGYAWSENAGWINFNPAHSQVIINSTTGDFGGYAWSENIGWIHFQNASPTYKVTRELNNPVSFSFTDQTNVPRNTTIISNSITVSGINTSVTISITGGEYDINGNDNWLNTTSSVVLNDTVKVRHTSSGNYSTHTDTVLTIGTKNDTFRSTTVDAPAPTPTPSTPPVISTKPTPTDLTKPVTDGSGTTLQKIQETKSIVGDNSEINITQNSTTKNLQISFKDSKYELTPVKVTQALAGTKPGIYVTVDGTIKVVTDSGQQIYMLSEPQKIDEFKKIFSDAGFNIVTGDYGEFRFVPSSSKRATTTTWYSARVAIGSHPVDDKSDTRIGLIAFPSDKLANTVTYAQQFYGNELLYRQYLYPTPADWDSLKTSLSSAFINVNIDLEGFISLSTQDETFKLLMDYSVRSGNTNTTGKLFYDAIGDKNQDGTIDYDINYGNGDKQIIYLIP